MQTYTKLLKETASALSLLYVEDDADIRSGVEKMLSRFFKEVVCAASGHEALDLFDSRRFDLVLTDLSMPDIDGVSLIKEVRRREGMQAIAVLSASYDDYRTLLELINCSVAGFITKPPVGEEMMKRLATICDRIHERQILMHYLEELESQQGLSSQSPGMGPGDCVTEDDDDFLFFPEPTVTTQSVEEDVYKDYFSYLSPEDLEDLEDRLDDIDASLLNAYGTSGPMPRYIESLGRALTRFGNVLMHYQFFSDIGTAVLELGTMLTNEHEAVIGKGNEMQMYLSGFCSVLQTFKQEVWEKESENPKLFNDSIKNDAVFIMGQIAPSNADTGDALVFF